MFSNVLHVPSLNQNLLLVLTLTCKHNFDVLIKSNTMEFILDGLPRFYASVGADRVAWLSGSTVVQSEVASPAQASDYELWHCHFSHLSHGRLKSLVEHKMVSDQVLPSVPPASSVPICSACLDGKQTRDSFPLTASRRSIPLELVHSDLHGPLPATVNGYKYWISFTDDAGSDAAGSSRRRVKPLMPSSSISLGQKSRLGRLSNRSGTTKVVSICLMSGRSSCLSMALRGNTLFGLPPNRMVLQSAPIAF